MSRIDSVIFDVGNVLIRWDPRNLYRRMGFADSDSDRIIAETGLLEMNTDLDRGRPFAEGIAELAVRHPAHRPFIEAWHARWPEMLGGPIEPNVALLADLKAAGVPVYAITNFARETFDIARSRYPFLDSFDDIVVSADVRLVKPDPEIFAVLLRRNRLDPRRSAYIDDSADNIATADRLGLATIHVSDEGVPVRVRLRELGLAV
jgi:2-haloacid dehalogenase